MNASNILLVFIGGGFGAVTRFLISSSVLIYSSKAWVGTLLSNIIGCIIFFIIFKTVPSYKVEIRNLLLVGFAGGLTTFSAFTNDYLSLIMLGDIAQGMICLSMNLTFCLILGYVILKLNMA